MSRERERSSRRFYRGESYSNLMALMDRGQQAEEENRWTFEVAWEAANKGAFTLYTHYVYICMLHTHTHSIFLTF